MRLVRFCREIYMGKASAERLTQIYCFKKKKKCIYLRGCINACKFMWKIASISSLPSLGFPVRCSSLFRCLYFSRTCPARLHTLHPLLQPLCSTIHESQESHPSVSPLVNHSHSCNIYKYRLVWISTNYLE